MIIHNAYPHGSLCFQFQAAAAAAATTSAHNKTKPNQVEEDEAKEAHLTSSVAISGANNGKEPLDSLRITFTSSLLLLAAQAAVAAAESPHNRKRTQDSSSILSLSLSLSLSFSLSVLSSFCHFVFAYFVIALVSCLLRWCARRDRFVRVKKLNSRPRRTILPSIFCLFVCCGFCIVAMERREEAALHRMATIARHISPSCQQQQASTLVLPSSSSLLQLSSCSASETPPPRRSNKYEQLHGSVSRELPAWTQPLLPSGPPFEDILYEKAEGEGIAKITISRPERRNAFRPLTVMELKRAFDFARDDPEVGVIIFTGKGTEAFCSGGDQAVRGKHGYVGSDNIGRLNILDVQVQIRRLPKPVVAMVAGYAVGGGHVLHMVCDITIAADNAVFGQTGPKVGSFDAGFGCSMMARLIGQKRAREMWFLARFYSAQEAINMGLVNTVVPLEKLEEETVIWCREMLRNSPMAIRLLKSALNAAEDGHAGLQELAGNATLLFYGSEEAIEGKTAYLEGRVPDFSKFPRLP